MGGYAGFLLAEAGADVVKVEPPRGENLRNRPNVHGAAYPFLALNVNKRSICLDLKTASGRDEFLRLVGVADVVFDNFSSGVMKRLNLDYPVLRATNPRIVYASGSGYGAGSRYEDYQAMDLTVQAMSGVMSVTGFPESPPVKAGVAISDFMAGVHLYAGIVTALLDRERTGLGSLVEVPMLDATLPTLLSSLAVVLGTEERSLREQEIVTAEWRKLRTTCTARSTDTRRSFASVSRNGRGSLRLSARQNWPTMRDSIPARQGS